MVDHIGLAVNYQEDIKDFYQDVLNFSEDYKFSIDSSITGEIFNIIEPVEVKVLCRDDTKLELFLTGRKEHKIFSHICLYCRDADDIYKRSEKGGFRSIVKKGKDKNTYFIRDKSGNMFEVKEPDEVKKV